MKLVLEKLTSTNFGCQHTNKDMNNINNKFKTDSLYLSAYLLAEDCILDRIEKLNLESDKVIFIFHETTTLKELVADYNTLRSMINPQKYDNALRNLRQIIHTQINN